MQSWTAGVEMCASVRASSSSARVCVTSCALLAAWTANVDQHLRIRVFRRPPLFSGATRRQVRRSWTCWSISVDRRRTRARNKLKEHCKRLRGRPCTPETERKGTIKMQYLTNKIGALLHRPIRRTYANPTTKPRHFRAFLHPKMRCFSSRDVTRSRTPGLLESRTRTTEKESRETDRSDISTRAKTLCEFSITRTNHTKIQKKGYLPAPSSTDVASLSRERG